MAPRPRPVKRGRRAATNGKGALQLVRAAGDAPDPGTTDHPSRWARPSLRTVVVASGKGGVGKSNLSANLAVALGERGLRVLLLDADFGQANLDLLLGVHPRWDLQHVLTGEKTIEEIVVDTTDACPNHGPAVDKILRRGPVLADQARIDQGFAGRLDSHPRESRGVAQCLRVEKAIGQLRIVDITPDKTRILFGIEVDPLQAAFSGQNFLPAFRRCRRKRRDRAQTCDDDTLRRHRRAIAPNRPPNRRRRR